MKNFAYLVLILALGSCQFFEDEKPYRMAEDLLTQDYASERKKNIENVHYQLKFDLTDKDHFQGTTAVQYQLKNKMNLSIDFTGGEVHELFVNGKRISPVNYNGFFIEIPQEFQKLGENSILVKYTHDYSRNGAGLYKYVDVKDGGSYLYSMFEPYDANKMFPCFDQPNLKATYTMSVLAPKDWHVITSVRESDIEDQGEFKQWSFPQSAKFSTYTFSLHAGDYFMWEDVAKTKKQEIPLRLFARKSLAKYVKTEDWFTWTKQGFDFFENYYSYPYPYVKYDQVIVPDFNFGAMENVASVAFNEDRYISKGEKSRSDRRKLATVLLHEMAHMWFGNLVTMDWWNDLWLNESFATHSSHVALVDATEFKEGWKTFNARSKQSAYRQDQSSNTHPVTQACRHTKEAFANFDSITYGKGASVLKQLSFLLGERTYKKALKGYFEEFAHKNTHLKDFMGEMSKASGRDLKSWEDRWLKTAMLNDVEVHFTCSKGRIRSFDIYQTGTKDFPTLRSHKTQIALFKKSRGFYKLNRTLSVEYSGETTSVPKLVGKLCPDIVYPNYMDHDYVTVTLDKTSLKNVESSLANLDDEFLKSILWSDLWGMVLNKKMDMERFLEIVEFNGLAEKDLDLISKVFSNVHSVLKEYYPDSGQPWVAKREVWVKFFEQAYMSKISEMKDDSKSQRIWFDNLVALAESPEVLRLLEKVIKKHQSGLPLSIAVDQDLRWDIISTLVANDYPGAMELMKKEVEMDKSKRGELNALFAKSLQPKIEVKQKYFKELISQDNKASFGWLRTIMFGLFPSQQKFLHKKFVDSFYSSIKQLAKTKDQYFSTTFAENLVPAFCDQKSSNQISSFLEAEKGLSFPVAKELKKALFENNRCYEMRKVLKDKGQIGDGL